MYKNTTIYYVLIMCVKIMINICVRYYGYYKTTLAQK